MAKKEKHRKESFEFYHRHKTEINARRRKRYKNNPKQKEYNKNFALKRKFGITLKQHKQMYINQNGCCATCDEPVEYSKIHTDHSHETGKVRGLLCCACNIFLGYVEGYPNLMEKIEDYLRRYDAK